MRAAVFIESFAEEAKIANKLFINGKNKIKYASYGKKASRRRTKAERKRRGRAIIKWKTLKIAYSRFLIILLPLCGAQFHSMRSVAYSFLFDFSFIAFSLQPGQRYLYTWCPLHRIVLFAWHTTRSIRNNPIREGDAFSLHWKSYRLLNQFNA